MAKEFETLKNSLKVTLYGEIDQYAAAELKERIDIEVQSCVKKNLIIDLSEVTMMDSSGIGLIVGRYKTVQALGGNIAICSPSPMIERIIMLSGIGKVIKCFKTADEAELYLKNLHEGESEK